MTDGNKESVLKKRRIKGNRQQKETVLKSTANNRKRTKSLTEKSQGRQSAGKEVDRFSVNNLEILCVSWVSTLLHHMQLQAQSFVFNM